MPDPVRQRYISDGGRSALIAKEVAAWREAHPGLVFCKRLKGSILPESCDTYQQSLGKIVWNKSSPMSMGPVMKRIDVSLCAGCKRFERE